KRMDCRLQAPTSTATTSFIDAMDFGSITNNSSSPSSTTTTTTSTLTISTTSNTNSKGSSSPSPSSPSTSSPKTTMAQSKKPMAVTFTDEQIQRACSMGVTKLATNNVQSFSATDPINDNNVLQGVVIKESNDFIIMRVNGVDLETYQYVYVVPKVKKYHSHLLPDVHFKRYYLANKWNGMNIQFFKYFDHDGNCFVGARPRTSHFLSNDKKGNALEVVNQIIKQHATSMQSFDIIPNVTFQNQCPELLLPLLQKDSHTSCQSMSFELCGNKLPHIVNYSFELALQPLMTIDGRSGAISPVINEHGVLTNVDEPITLANLQERATLIKQQLLDINQTYRKENNMQENMYWYNHYLEEGRVLYILNDNNQLVEQNNIFSIKPTDAEKYHWEQFDSGIQTKVLMIVQELKEKGSPVNKATLQKELELDQYSWAKWEDDILDLAILPEFDSGNNVKQQSGKKGQQTQTSSPSTTPQPRNNDNQRVLITVGFPASGKSYFASRLAERGWKRVNQDDLGTRKKCEDVMIASLKQGESVVIDRCNFDIQQRRTWVRLAHQYGVKNIHLLWFKMDTDLCKKRIVVREDHPTIPKGNEGIEIINKFEVMFVEPGPHESFSDIQVIQSEDESNAAIESYAKMVEAANAAAAAAAAATLSVPEVSLEQTDNIIVSSFSALTVDAVDV
ncbi:hypothetical protein SAMD00019534_092640, partial [Acytostelium subglobosum LB1]|uniref:hypothetical protein n=1 Tax=Acytostelium subglobosum LB1 TaxID=1410327 RepID=UPI000644A92D